MKFLKLNFNNDSFLNIKLIKFPINFTTIMQLNLTQIQAKNNLKFHHFPSLKKLFRCNKKLILSPKFEVSFFIFLVC